MQRDKLDAAFLYYCDDSECPQGATIADLGKASRQLMRWLPEFIATADSENEPRGKRLSRADQWQAAIDAALAAIDDLAEVQSGYQDWLDSMPETLRAGPTAEKLEAVVSIDLEGARDAITELQDVDFPLGFGRD